MGPARAFCVQPGDGVVCRAGGKAVPHRSRRVQNLTLLGVGLLVRQRKGGVRRAAIHRLAVGNPDDRSQRGGYEGVRVVPGL